jgi:hypothetical protein
MLRDAIAFEEATTVRVFEVIPAALNSDSGGLGKQTAMRERW